MRVKLNDKWHIVYFNKEYNANVFHLKMRQNGSKSFFYILTAEKSVFTYHKWIYSIDDRCPKWMYTIVDSNKQETLYQTRIPQEILDKFNIFIHTLN